MKNNLWKITLICSIVLNLYFLADSIFSHLNREQLAYEPAIVELTGTIVTRSEFGPPNYGETPEEDESVIILVLQLDEGVSVKGDVNSDINTSSFDNVKEVQVVHSEGVNVNNYLNKKVRITGKLFQAHTGHHYTDVLITPISIRNIETTETAKQDIFDENQKIQNSFCTSVQSGNEDGILVINYVAAYGTYWDATWYCIRENGTEILKQGQHNETGAEFSRQDLEPAKVTTSSKSYLSIVQNAIKKYNFHINDIPEKDWHEFGTCHQTVSISIVKGGQQMRGWWIGSICGKENDPPEGIEYPNTKYFATNMEGSYAQLFDFIEKTIRFTN